jgi:hypothetical protein
MRKAPKKLGIDGILLNNMKAMYDEPASNITLNGEKLKPFPLKSRTRQRFLLSPLLCNTVLEFLTRAIRHEKEIKWINIVKEEIKLSVVADDMILYLTDAKNSTKKSLRSHKQFQKSSRIQNQYTKISSILLYTNNEQSEKEIRKIIPFTIASKKNEIPRSIWCSERPLQ